MYFIIGNFIFCDRWDPAVLNAQRCTVPCIHSCFLSLEAPIQRVCGLDTPFPLVYEKVYMPDKFRSFEAIKKVIEY
jgi:pyruvate/2-oxoglutarate/acetoin dehydrogenase E1 component